MATSAYKFLKPIDRLFSHERGWPLLIVVLGLFTLVAPRIVGMPVVVVLGLIVIASKALGLAIEPPINAAGTNGRSISLRWGVVFLRDRSGKGFNLGSMDRPRWSKNARVPVSKVVGLTFRPGASHDGNDILNFGIDTRKGSAQMQVMAFGAKSSPNAQKIAHLVAEGNGRKVSSALDMSKATIADLGVVERSNTLAEGRMGTHWMSLDCRALVKELGSLNDRDVVIYADEGKHRDKQVSRDDNFIFNRVQEEGHRILYARKAQRHCDTCISYIA